MDSLTFIAELVKALAWPVALIVIIVLLRKPLASLIPLLHRFRYKDFELEFNKQVQEIRDEAKEELPPAGTTERIVVQSPDPILELARVSPRAAVIETWRQVESAALDAARRSNLPLPYLETVSPLRVFRALERAQIVDTAKGAIFNDLRALRNQAAHAPEFALSTQAAIEYTELARRLTEYLRSAGHVVE